MEQKWRIRIKICKQKQNGGVPNPDYYMIPPLRVDEQPPGCGLPMNTDDDINVIIGKDTIERNLHEWLPD